MYACYASVWPSLETAWCKLVNDKATAGGGYLCSPELQFFVTLMALSIRSRSLKVELGKKID